MGTNVQVSGAPHTSMFHIATNTLGIRDVENGDKCASEQCPSYKPPFSKLRHTPGSRDAENADKCASQWRPPYQRPFSTSRLTRRVAMWEMGTTVQVSGAPRINLHFPHRD